MQVYHTSFLFYFNEVEISSVIAKLSNWSARWGGIESFEENSIDNYNAHGRKCKLQSEERYLTAETKPQKEVVVKKCLLND